MSVKKIIYILCFSLIIFLNINRINVKAASEKYTYMYSCKYQINDTSSSQPSIVFITYNPNDNVGDYEVYKNLINPDNLVETIFHATASDMGFVYDANKSSPLTCPQYLYYVSTENSNGESNFIHYVGSNNLINDDNTLLEKVNSYDGKIIAKSVYKATSTSSSTTKNETKSGDCIYRSSDGEVTLSLDEKLKLTAKIRLTGKSYTSRTIEEKNQTDVKNQLLKGVCPNYVMGENDWGNRLYFGDSESDIMSKFGNKLKKQNKIDIKAPLVSTTLKSVEEKLQEAQSDKNRLEEINDELDELNKQYVENNCDNNKDSAICKDIIKKQSELGSEQQKKYESLKDNDQSQMVGGIEDVMEKAEKIMAQLEAWNIGISIYNGEDLECSDIASFAIILKQVLYLIRVLATVMFIIFGVLDYVKATVSSDQDMMKKATSNFTKRGIVFVILFLLPTILSVILKLAGINENDPLCNEQLGL